MNACIHGWLLQRTGIISSGFANLRSSCGVVGPPAGGCEISTDWFPATVGTMCTLCIVGSLFVNRTGCPTITPTTCGIYRQPFWSMSTGCVGAAYTLFPSPSFI